MSFKIILLILTMLTGEGGLNLSRREPVKPAPPRKVCLIVETPMGIVRRCG